MRESQMVVIAVNTLDLIIYKIWNTSDEVISLQKMGKTFCIKKRKNDMKLQLFHGYMPHSLFKSILQKLIMLAQRHVTYAENPGSSWYICQILNFMHYSAAM